MVSINKPIIDLENAIENFEHYLKVILENYRVRVREYYQEEYDKKPSAYRLMAPIKLSVVFGNYQYTEIFSASNSGIDEVEVFCEIMDNWDDYKKIINLPDHLRKERFIDICNIEKDDVIEVRDNSYGVDNKNPEFHFHDPFTIERAKNLADGDHGGYQLEIAMADLFVPKDVLEDNDAELLISYVDDVNFEYEYTEAIKAYECRLYLACVVLSGVALESLLKITLERRGINFSQRDMLAKLIEIATSKGLLSRREASSLSYFKELRNAGAHGNTGRFSKTDAVLTLRKLYEIGTSLFEETM